MKTSLALVAFVFGLIGVGMAALQNNYVFRPQPPAVVSDRSLKEVATDAAKTLLEEKVLRKTPPQPSRQPNDPRRQPLHPYQVTYTSLGVVAIGLGVFAWTKRAHTRLSVAAVGLGIVAVAWEWVLIAISTAIMIFILSQFAM